MKNYFLFIPILVMLVGCNRTEPLSDTKILNSKDSIVNKIGSEQNSDASLFSEITCPKCGHTETEKLPTEVCLVSYSCKNCREVMHPKDGDCCVFCTYGTHKCPSKQDD